MFRAFSNIPIFRRLAIAFALATLIPILVIVLLGNFFLQSSQVRSQAVHTSFDAQNIATREQINLQRMNALLQARFAQIYAQSSTALQGDPSLRASGGLTEGDVIALEIDFNQTLVSYQRDYELATSDNMSTIRSILNSDAADQGHQVINDQQTALNAVGSVGKEWQTYQVLQDKVLKELESNTPYETAYTDFYQANLSFLPLKNNWQVVVDTATEMGTTVTQVGPSLINPLLIYTAIAIVFTLLVIIGAIALINATIISPLNQLVSLTKRVAKGETEARAIIRGRDEIYQVASSMNGMLDHIVQLIQEAQARHTDLQTQIQKMISELSGVGEGNLRIQVQVSSAELIMLANSFNKMAGQLNNLVVNVKILSRGVQNAALQAYGYTEQLVDNADEQIQQITKAAGEINHVANSNRQVAERAQALYNVAYEARQAAQKGRKAVQQTIQGMEHINENVGATSQRVLQLGERSREIGTVLEVISNLAQQTNRLALDASVQASMAGEHGQGFGAVAVDIRRLAELAKNQAALIAPMIQNIIDDINIAATSMQETAKETETGTHLAKEVSTALEQIFSAVERQASEIEITNQVARQQLESSKRVVQIMQQVSDSTRQGSVITRNVTQQMEGLAQIAGQLLGSVEVFKLREDRTNTRYAVAAGPSYPSLNQPTFNNPGRSIPPSTQSVNRTSRPLGANSGDLNGQDIPGSPRVPYQPNRNMRTPTPPSVRPGQTEFPPYDNGNTFNNGNGRISRPLNGDDRSEER